MIVNAKDCLIQHCSYPVAVIIDQWNALCVPGSLLDPQTGLRINVSANENPLANLMNNINFQMV